MTRYQPAPSTAEDASMAGGEGSPIPQGAWKDQRLSRLDRVKAHRVELGSTLKDALEAVDEYEAQATIADRIAALRPPADPRPDALFDAATEAEVDRIMAMSDEEILADAKAAGLDPEKEASRCPYYSNRPDPLEALREAREALVYYSKAEAYGRRIILNVEVMYDRGKKARQALANIKALMGEAG
jgi:hypothetical protein